jgi:hypothetical protein
MHACMMHDGIFARGLTPVNYVTPDSPSVSLLHSKTKMRQKYSDIMVYNCRIEKKSPRMTETINRNNFTLIFSYISSLS